MNLDPTIALSWGLGGVVVLSLFYAAKRALEKNGWIDQWRDSSSREAQARTELFNELKGTTRTQADAAKINAESLRNQSESLESQSKDLASQTISIGKTSGDLNSLRTAAMEHCRFLKTFVRVSAINDKDAVELNDRIDKISAILEHKQ